MATPSVARSLFSYSSAMILAQLVIAAQGVLVIRWMEPESLGLWLGLQLIALFGVHAHFGLLNAVNP